MAGCHLGNDLRNNAGLYAQMAFFVVFMGAAVAFSVWVYFFADCGSVEWLPTKDLPARCLRQEMGPHAP